MHQLCRDCYALREGNRVPFMLSQPVYGACCLCGRSVVAGVGLVMYRLDPAAALCGGVHDDD